MYRWRDAGGRDVRGEGGGDVNVILLFCIFSPISL